LQASCLTNSALVVASEALAIDDLEELHDPDAPELVNIAQAEAVRVCRVAELVRVNTNAKQIRDEETKTHCLLVATTKARKKQKSPQGGKF
jgi:hypothetical protein